METLTRLVTDSLVRHGFDRPIDPRRLQWSRWFRCDSTHSLLVVPSKPGIFAIAEEIMEYPSKTHVGTVALGCPPERSSGVASSAPIADLCKFREGHDFSPEPALSKRSAPKGAVTPPAKTPALAAAGVADGAHTDDVVRRMLAVLQFSEDDDMAFTLDRMFTLINPMRARLSSGRCFLRFVVIEDQDQRRSICSALNQWMLSSAEKASGIPAAFSSSVELTTSGETSSTARAEAGDSAANVVTASGVNKNLHCPQPLPSGF